MKKTILIIISLFLAAITGTKAELITNSGGANYIPYVKGKDAPITWTASSFQNNVDIVIWDRTTQKTHTIAKNIKNTGKYTWDIPADFPAGKFYKLFVRDTKHNGKYIASMNYVEIFTEEPNYEPNQQLSVYAYPNPASDKLYIKNHKVAYGKIEIYDNAGHCYLSIFPKAEIDISDLPSGVYYVVLNGRMDKIVKE